MTCELGHLDGAYVLGALAPAERQAFERHLAGCKACALSVRELAGMPGLLGRVDASALEDERAVALPDTLLPALLVKTRQRERRRLLASAGLAAAAVVIGAAVTYGVVGGGTAPAGEGPVAGETAIAEPAPAPLDMTPVGRAPVAGRLVVESVAWGTRLGLICTYEGADEEGGGATYLLLVRTADGRTEQVGTWLALPGRTMELAAATAAQRDDIEAVEVRLASGLKVLELTI